MSSGEFMANGDFRTSPFWKWYEFQKGLVNTTCSCVNAPVSTSYGDTQRDSLPLKLQNWCQAPQSLVVTHHAPCTISAMVHGAHMVLFGKLHVSVACCVNPSLVPHVYDASSLEILAIIRFYSQMAFSKQTISLCTCKWTSRVFADGGLVSLQVAIRF